MRAADQAHSPETTAVASASGALVKLLVAAIATAALLTLWRPAVVHAQETPAQPPAAAKADAKADTKAAAKPAEKPAEAKPVAAQTRTHVVKPGETLWALAARYYGDGHSWQQLARANKIPTDGAKPPLEIGMTLSVPVAKKVASAKAAAVAAAPADSSVPKVALLKAGEGSAPKSATEPRPNSKADTKSPAGSLAAQTSGKGNAAGRGNVRSTAKSSKEAAAPVASTSPASSQPETLALQQRQQTLLTRDGQVKIGLVSSDEQSASRTSKEILTVFHRDIPDAAEAQRRTNAALRPNTPVARQGELDAAPYLVNAADLLVAGTITGRVGALPSTLEAHAERALRTDEIELQAAPKRSYAVGDRLQSFASVPSTLKGKVVVLPTGMVEVTSVKSNGSAIAVVREQSARIEQGQRLVAPTGAPAPRVVAEKLATPDVASTVVWLDPAQAIPTLQSYLLIGAGSGKGVKAGDEFALYFQPKGGNEAQQAVARIVRVGTDHAAAVIVKQSGADITPGMTAKRIAKAP